MSFLLFIALSVSGRGLSRESPGKISHSAVPSPLLKVRIRRVQFCNYTSRLFLRGRVLMEFSSPEEGGEWPRAPGIVLLVY